MTSIRTGVIITSYSYLPINVIKTRIEIEYQLKNEYQLNNNIDRQLTKEKEWKKKWKKI